MARDTFVSLSLPPSSRFLLRTVQRTYLPFQFYPPATPSFQVLKKFVSFVDDDLAVRGQPAHFTASRAPTRRKLAPGHPHLRSRSATRSRPFAVQSSGRQTCVNSLRMSRVPFLTHNLRATHYEHRAPCVTHKGEGIKQQRRRFLSFYSIPWMRGSSASSLAALASCVNSFQVIK